MLRKLSILLLSLNLTSAMAAPTGAIVVDKNICISYLSDLENVKVTQKFLPEAVLAEKQMQAVLLISI